MGWLNGWHMTVPVFLHVYNTIKLRLPLATKGGTAHEYVCMCVCVWGVGVGWLLVSNGTIPKQGWAFIF